MKIQSAAGVGIAAITGLGMSANDAPYQLVGGWSDSQTQRQLSSAQTSRSRMSFDEKYVDAKLEAVEARTDAKFSQLLGKLDNISDAQGRLETKMTSVESEAKTWKWNLVMTGLALGGLILGLFAFGTQILELATSLISAGAATGGS